MQSGQVRSALALVREQIANGHASTVLVPLANACNVLSLHGIHFEGAPILQLKAEFECAFGLLKTL